MTAYVNDVVRRLRAGTRVDRVADLVGVDRRTVTRIAHEHGMRITPDDPAVIAARRVQLLEATDHRRTE